MNKYISTFCLCATLLIFSCTDPNLIGLEVQPPSDGIKVALTTADNNLKLSTILEDFLRSDETSILLLGTITSDYIFGESGLWKVEISYVIDPQDIDSQITDFHRIENIISEIYGSPVSTQQIESGPGLSFNNISTVNFSRAFFMSSWVEMPSRIELILHSLVQKNMNDFSIIKDKTSHLRLVYYNPDFMVESEEVKVEVIPSIFDLY